MAKCALILGISGQDGALLARLLLGKGYVVHGTSRDAQMASFGNLRTVGVLDQVTLHSAVPTDFRSVLQVMARVAPDEIYLLAGQSSVGLSFEQPVETLESLSLGTLNVLEAVRFIGRPVRLYHAGSSECFGESATPASEQTAFRPRSPYAVAKASAFWTVANYREAYGLYACSGLLFNHESPLRPERFVTRKIIAAACRIANGSGETLSLGNLSIERDWGWAPDFVRAMWLMLQQDSPPEDLVIATGRTHRLEDFVQAAFAGVGLEWRAHVVSNPALMRPADLQRSSGCADRAWQRLGWRASTEFERIIAYMLAAEQGHDWPMGSA